jgi:hypothetical protein
VTVPEKTILLLFPATEKPKVAERTRLVIAGLQARGWRVLTLADLVPEQRRRALLSEAAVLRALQRVDRVAVLPRADGTIGGGTLRDLRLAHSRRVPVSVFGPTGCTLRVEDADLVEVGQDRRTAARFGCYGQRSR